MTFLALTSSSIMKKRIKGDIVGKSGERFEGDGKYSFLDHKQHRFVTIDIFVPNLTENS